MVESFILFAINTIIFMTLWHFGTRAYFYVKSGSFRLPKARLKKKLKQLVDKL